MRTANGGIGVAIRGSVLNFVRLLVALNFSAERAFWMGRINSVDKFLRCETGLELSEYAVAAALITALTLIAFTVLGNVIVDRINTLATSVNP